MGIADHIKNGISRRGFVLGGAAAGAATVLAGCSKKTGTSDDAAGEPQVIKDDSKIISITDEYEAVDIDLELSRARDMHSTMSVPATAYSRGLR